MKGKEAVMRFDLDNLKLNHTQDKNHPKVCNANTLEMASPQKNADDLCLGSYLELIYENIIGDKYKKVILKYCNLPTS